jgi:predicted histone-like DNA-binding protein
MKYKLTQRRNPQQPEAAQKWYASPINAGKVSQKNISEDIVALSSLSRGDVSSVIENLLDTVPKYLLMGKSVNLGGLGTFRLSFSSKGVVKPEEFNTSLVKGAKIIFTPSVELKNSLKGLKFEKI